MHHSFFLFPSYISFSFCVRFHPPLLFPSLPSSPPSPKRGLHAFALRGHRSLLTRDRTHHATFSSAFLAEWSIFRERGGKEGDGAYNWVQLGPAGACSASKDSSLPPSSPSRASRRRKFELRNNATVTRDPLSKGVFWTSPFSRRISPVYEVIMMLNAGNRTIVVDDRWWSVVIRSFEYVPFVFPYFSLLFFFFFSIFEKRKKEEEKSRDLLKFCVQFYSVFKFCWRKKGLKGFEYIYPGYIPVYPILLPGELSFK